MPMMKAKTGTRNAHIKTRAAELTTVGISKMVHRRLSAFRSRQKMKPSMTSYVNAAITEYLDREEKRPA